MPNRTQLTDDDFAELFRQMGATALARHLGLTTREVYRRRKRVEQNLQVCLESPNRNRPGKYSVVIPPVRQPARVPFQLDEGVILVGSDAHYWPNYVSTAHRAFVRFCKELKPKAVVMNGDALDGATVSRHPRIGWEARPSLVEEIDACKERLGEIKKAAGNNCRYVWTLGNHDARFETRLANVAPEYAKIHGVHLKDHFPEWWPCWRMDINGDTIIKHRFKGGIHATRNNALNSAKTIVTGHLHSLKITPLTTDWGTVWGVDSGTLADPAGPQFLDYTEDNPKDWRSGFVVLTWRNRELMWPEAVYVIDEETVGFRGQKVKV